MERCVICEKEYNDYNPMSRPPTCSVVCWEKLIYEIDHQGKPCWIPGCLEVFCGTHTDGICYKCEVFKIEEEIKKRGLDKEALIGKY